MRRTLTLTLALAAAACGAAPASAATIIWRPSATSTFQSPWMTLPFGARADAVLADQVTQPAAPSTAGDLLTAGTGNGAYTGVTFPGASLPAGVEPTNVTAWVYAQVGTAQALTLSLWRGMTLLGSTSLTTGGTAGWRSYSLSPTPTAGQLAQLGLALRTDGTAGMPTTTKVYAAYAQIDVPDPPAAPDGRQDTTELAPVTPPTDGDTDGELSDALGSEPPAAKPAPAVVIAAAAAIALPAQSRTLPVDLSCPSDALGFCRGRVRIELLGAMGRARHRRARAARCARGCRVIGESPFTIAAGKSRPVRVHLGQMAMRLIPRGRSARVRISVTSRDRGHATTTSTRVVTLRRIQG